ncbi:MAG: alpha/beta hydrolase [Bacteroidota bacterium]
MKKLIVIAIVCRILLCSHSDAQPAGSTIPYGSNPRCGKTVHLRGFGMYVEEYGKGKPLLVIHGNGGSIASMKNQISCFAKNYRVIAADSRSQGKSADGSDSLSYEMMADDYSALLDSLHVKSACVIGWSDGGIIGLLLAIRHPGKVKRLAATGANIRPDSSAVAYADIRGMEIQVERMKKLPQDAAVRNEIKLTRLMIREPNISHQALQSITCPVLIIGGDHDIIKTEHTLEISRNIPGSSLWILPGSGHDTCIRFKDDFNEQVRRFFSAD